MKDQFNRKIDYLRISVTDRCNLRCRYCMPAYGIEKVSHEEILSFEDFIKIAELFAKLGIKKIKITGGEPLVRKGIFAFAKNLKNISGIDEITLTTNGILLSNYKEEIFSSEIDGINISLDTLNPQKFRALTRGGELTKVLRSIDFLMEREFPNLKINTVPILGLNDDEIIPFAQFAKEKMIQVRFIELMPIGFAKDLRGITQEKILDMLRSEFGTEHLVKKRLGNGPAQYITFDGFKGNIGFIDAIDHKFCQNCNRLRLTSKGYLKLCLQFSNGIDLKSYIRGEIAEEKMMEQIRDVVFHKPLENKFYQEDDMEFTMNEIGG